MFKILNEKEKEAFVKQYFKDWAIDIIKVSCISYKNIKEYLINDHYIFRVKD